MNKQELIERMKGFKKIFGNKIEYIELDLAIELASRLDEPQKVTIPQSVGDYIEHAKESDWDLEDLFEFVGDQECGEIQKWFYDECNQDTLALAWIFGFTVEKEKRYRVKIIGIKDYYSYLNYRKEENGWTVESKMEVDTIRTSHTHKELEQAGFSWVFDCPGVEVEEVE
ncbi:DUF1642 domain-containing protein [Streptococcus australis]|uniref:DUF1642 domain-containing protein n=1 Tax=Streptococcus australis TaxID=113107 RepID=UPI0039C25732